MAKYLYVCGGNVQIQSTTRYYPLAGEGSATAEARAQIRIRDSYTWTNLGLTVNANAGTGTSTVKSRVNGADGNQAISISAGATGDFEDTTHSDSLADGDLVAVQIAAAGGGNLTIDSVSSLVTHSGDVAIEIAAAPLASGSGGSGLVLNGATSWNALHGPLVGASGAESLSQVTCRNATTLSRLRAYVSVNSASGTSTVKLRKNGADGNQAVSITTGATGEFEDTSNSDSLVAGDEACYQFTAGGSGAITFSVAQCESSSGLMAAANLHGSAFSGTTLYGQIGGFPLSLTVESRSQVPARTTSLRFANLCFSTNANTRSVATSVALRRNGSAVISLSVPANTTGLFEDTSSEATPSATSDDFNFSVSSAAGSGSITTGTLSIGMLSIATVTIAGATAAATAAAAAGAVQIGRAVPGATAAATAAAAAGVIATVRNAAVSGATAAATAAAGAGTVATFPAAIILGAAAAATAAAAAASIAAIGTKTIAGERATAAAAASSGGVVVARTVPGETAAAAALALAAVLEALRIGHPHPVLPGASARVRRLPAPRAHAQRPGDV